MAESLQRQVAEGRRASESDRQREERIANCEQEFSDGFLSSWADNLTRRKGQLAQSIIDAGGQWYFWRAELTDLDGEKVAAKLIDGRFGKCWAICDGDGQFTGEFVTAHAARKATMERRGYRERIVLFAAAAIADLHGSGQGLSGAHTVRAIVRPADRGVEYTGTCGGGTREDAEAHALTLRENGFGWQEMVFA